MKRHFRSDRLKNFSACGKITNSFTEDVFDCDCQNCHISRAFQRKLFLARSRALPMKFRMRDWLKENIGRNFDFCGNVKQVHDDRVLVVPLIDISTGKIVADHIWIKINDGQNPKINSFKVLRFRACVLSYKHRRIWKQGVRLVRQL